MNKGARATISSLINEGPSKTVPSCCVCVNQFPMKGWKKLPSLLRVRSGVLSKQQGESASQAITRPVRESADECMRYGGLRIRTYFQHFSFECTASRAREVCRRTYWKLEGTEPCFACLDEVH